MRVAELAADPLPRRDPGRHFDRLRVPLGDGHDDRLAPLRDVRLLERDADVREHVQGRDALLRLAHSAQAIGLPQVERDPPADDAVVGPRVPADHDLGDDDLLPLDDVEADARARVVDRRLERVLYVGVGVALLLVEVDEPAPRVLELERVRRFSQGELRRAREASLGDRARAGEAHVVEHRARPELHRDAEGDLGLALDPAERIGDAGERRVEVGDGEREVRRVVGAGVGRRRRERERDAASGGGAPVAGAAQDADGADLGVEVPLVSIELLHVDRGAVVGVGGEGRVGLEIEGRHAGPVADSRRMGDRGVEAARIGVLDQVGAGELLLEEAVDLAADLAGRAGAAAAEVFHLVELETRIRAAGDHHPRVLDDVEDEEMDAIAPTAAGLERDLDVEEAPPHVEVFHLLEKVAGGEIGLLVEVERGRERGGVVVGVAFEAGLEVGTDVDADAEGDRDRRRRRGRA